MKKLFLMLSLSYILINSIMCQNEIMYIYKNGIIIYSVPVTDVDSINFLSKITLPVLSTIIPSNITQSTVKTGGNIYNNGGDKILEKGVCWSTSPNPTLSNNKIKNYETNNNFICDINVLEPNTTYNIRAYAINSEGTAYGENCSFKTLNKITLPNITTKAVNYNSYMEVFTGGDITDNGGGTILEKGICWSSSQNPTINNSKIIFTGNNNSYDIKIKENTIGIMYYARAYAKNSAGISYGNQVAFISGNFTDIDGNIYGSVKLGNQIWMKQNLRTKKYSNGDAIPYKDWNNNQEGRYAPSNHPNTLSRYGYMYNWYAAIDWRNPCPSGWSVPLSSDWRTLNSFLGGSSVAGKKLKSKEKTTYNWHNYSSNTNETNFSAFPNGYLSSNGSDYNQITYQGHFWTKSEGMINFSYYGVGAVMYDSSDKVTVDNYNKSSGKAIRCIYETQ